MIYFLVNNDYHIDMDLKLTSQLSDFKLGLIQVPYILKVIDRSDIFDEIYNFPELIVPSLIGFFTNPGKIYKSFTRIDQELAPKNTDILLVHTEIELLNQYVIQKFYEAGAKVYLLEDGTATMCTYNIIPKKAPMKDRIRGWILKNFYKFKYTTIKRFGGEVLPVMNDDIFQGAIVNHGKSILRDIKCFKLKPNDERITIKYENGMIFFGQALYFWFLSEAEYVGLVRGFLSAAKHFSPFYFKFHPSDTDFVKRETTRIIEQEYPDIIIIGENDMAEVLIHKFPVQYVMTFNSTAALNMINKRVIPIFINYLFNKAFPNDTLLAFDGFLESIGCNVPHTVAEIKPGFRAFSDSPNNQETYIITEILNKK
jgi:hypothetical protein